MNNKNTRAQLDQPRGLTGLTFDVPLWTIRCLREACEPGMKAGLLPSCHPMKAAGILCHAASKPGWPRVVASSQIDWPIVHTSIFFFKAPELEHRTVHVCPEVSSIVFSWAYSQERLYRIAASVAHCNPITPYSPKLQTESEFVGGLLFVCLKSSNQFYPMTPISNMM